MNKKKKAKLIIDWNNSTYKIKYHGDYPVETILIQTLLQRTYEAEITKEEFLNMMDKLYDLGKEEISDDI